MEFGEMKRNTSNWSNFGMLLRRAGLTASAGLSCFHPHILWKIYDKVYNLNCLNHTLTASLHFSNHSITKFYTESDGEKKFENRSVFGEDSDKICSLLFAHPVHD